MTIETLLRARLVADNTVSGLVSTRIYPVILPQKPTLPAITFSKVSGVRMHNLSGTAGRAVARISFNCWATTYLGAQAVAAAVRASLDGFAGTLSDSGSPAETIRTNILLDNEIDFYEDETGVYRILQDYTLSHTET